MKDFIFIIFKASWNFDKNISWEIQSELVGAFNSLSEVRKKINNEAKTKDFVPKISYVVKPIKWVNGYVEVADKIVPSHDIKHFISRMDDNIAILWWYPFRAEAMFTSKKNSDAEWTCLRVIAVKTEKDAKKLKAPIINFRTKPIIKRLIALERSRKLKAKGKK